MQKHKKYSKSGLSKRYNRIFFNKAKGENMGVSGWQIAIIVLVIVLLFGGKKIPELAKGMGSGIKNFKKAMKEDEEEVAPKNVEGKTNVQATQAKEEEKQA